MDGIVSNDSIELQLIVETYFPQSGERLNPETYHSFIGKIVCVNINNINDLIFFR